MKMEKIVEILKQTLASNKTFEFPVKGTSMQPLLHTNDLVELDKPTNLKKNDIILYQRKTGEYVLHRIVGIKDNYYILCGDHQYIKEYPIYKDQVLAKVISIKGKTKKRRLYLFSLKFYIIRRIYSKFF